MRGDATEVGILKCYETIEGDSQVVRDQNPQKIAIPFNSRNKYQVEAEQVLGVNTGHWHSPARRSLSTRWRAASTGSS